MKSFLLSYLFLLCLPLASYSQFTAGGISAQAGLGYIPYHYGDYGNVHITAQNRPLSSFQLGAFAAYQFTRHSGLEAELNCVLQQGYSSIYTSGQSEASFMSTTRLGYLTLPIRYTYTIHHFSIMGGVQSGLFLHGWQMVDGTWYTPDTVHFSNSSGPSISMMDFGITLGVQQKICDRFFVTLTGFQSLANIVGPGNIGSSVRNTNVMAGIRYRIFLAQQ